MRQPGKIKVMPFIIRTKYDEAIKAYDEAIGINPKDAESWNNKGLALLDQNTYEEGYRGV